MRLVAALVAADPKLAWHARILLAEKTMCVLKRRAKTYFAPA
jgi:hypothetical protein